MRNYRFRTAFFHINADSCLQYEDDIQQPISGNEREEAKAGSAGEKDRRATKRNVTTADKRETRTK